MKRTIAIVAGGESSEHEVSLRSAQGLYSFIDKERYNLEVELHNRVKNVINVSMIIKAVDIGDLPRSEKKTTRVFDYRY